jgi:hypothetical protein
MSKSKLYYINTKNILNKNVIYNIKFNLILKDMINEGKRIYLTIIRLLH